MGTARRKLFEMYLHRGGPETFMLAKQIRFTDCSAGAKRKTCSVWKHTAADVICWKCDILDPASESLPIVRCHNIEHTMLFARTSRYLAGSREVGRFPQALNSLEPFYFFPSI